MAWSLEIHHIDVGQGDATFIVARDVNQVTGAVLFERSALIDGGRLNQAVNIDNYITGLVPQVPQLDVMVATHYDQDHFNGLRGLLNLNVNTYNNTIIFDRGEQGNLTVKRRSNGGYNVTVSNREPDYTRYLNAIASQGARTRVTQLVSSTTALTQGLQAAGWQDANWIVGKELLWTNGDGNPDPTLYGGNAPNPPLPVPAPAGNIPWPAGVPAPGNPGGPPAIICIAANQHILQPNGGTVQIQGGLLAPPQRVKNEKSLVFLVKFNNFLYYIGADIETTQEDDTINNANGIMHYFINAMGVPNATPVHAMKCSHHGSGESSSQAFINTLDPRAAFISCGTNNGHGANLPNWPTGHPQQRVLNDLEAQPNLQNYYMTADRHNDDFCRRMNTGTGAYPFAYTPKAIVAGAWGHIAVPPNPPAPPGPSPCAGNWPNDGAAGPIYGDIILDVSEPQSGWTIPPGGAAPVLAAGGAANFDVTYTHPPLHPGFVVQLQGNLLPVPTQTTNGH